MSLVEVYEIRCPDGHTIELPETILNGIVRHLQGSYTGNPVLNFVCSECKTAFYFDYQKREPAGWTDAPRQISEFHVLSVQSGCDGSNCIDHVVLVAIRSRDNSEQSILQETKEWNVAGITCNSGYRALPIGTPKRSGIQFYAGGL
jgi:hypothetical protein